MSLTLYQGPVDTRGDPSAPALAQAAGGPDAAEDGDAAAGLVDLRLGALVGHLPSLGTEATLQIGDAAAPEAAVVAPPAPVAAEPAPPPLLLLGPGLRVANAKMDGAATSCLAAFGSVDALTLHHVDPAQQAAAGLGALMVLG